MAKSLAVSPGRPLEPVSIPSFLLVALSLWSLSIQTLHPHLPFALCEVLDLLHSHLKFFSGFC